MENSAGSADREMETIESSIEYKLNRFSQTWTGMWQDLFKRQDVGAVIDAFTSISEAIGFVADKLGLLGTLVAGGTIFASLKNVG